ncbi:MAG: hypothetical protein KF812_06795 [Fimbriimonadaceae bacterium]|nr:hypothetical protein [Fimbriimonadaceae bacterium]
MKTVVGVIAAIVAIWLALKVFALAWGILSFILPAVIVLGVGYIVFRYVTGQKSLSGRRDSSLP